MARVFLFTFVILAAMCSNKLSSAMCEQRREFPQEGALYAKLQVSRWLRRHGNSLPLPFVKEVPLHISETERRSCEISIQQIKEVVQLNESPSYRDILAISHELWSGEQKYVNSPVCFDWFDLRASLGLPNPPYVDILSPPNSILAPTYTQVIMTDPNTHKGKLQSHLAFIREPQAHQKLLRHLQPLDLPLYEPALDENGIYPLSPYLFLTPFKEQLSCPITVEDGSSLSTTVNDLVSCRQPLKHIEVVGRGVLGKWGPNHAGDAIITRIHPTTGKLQVVLIRRTDGSGTYALPGGFVDLGEEDQVVHAIVREFVEEAAAYLLVHDVEDMDEDKLTSLRALQDIFGKFSLKNRKIVWTPGHSAKWGRLIYAGAVADERNTRNAWMETVALHWHVPPEHVHAIKLQAGDDAAAGSCAFYDVVDDDVLTTMGVIPLKNLFASHSALLAKAIEGVSLYEEPQTLNNVP